MAADHGAFQEKCVRGLWAAVDQAVEQLLHAAMSTEIPRVHAGLALGPEDAGG
jgi:hypothetical protein